MLPYNGALSHTPHTQIFEPYLYKYLDPDRLRQRCFMSIEDYNIEGEEIKTPKGIYYFKDNGADILAVAHLDTVQGLHKFVPVEGGRKIYNPQLDDRLGAYTILDLLPSLGLKYDILLTEGEETGNSTAAHFKAPEGKEYLWMFEVDRMSDDTVCYHYENDKLVQRLKSVGCKIGIGSFTDISVLTHLGIQGMNFGCGYYNNHSTEAYFLVDQFESQIDRIVEFYQKYKDTKLEYDPKTCGRRSYTNNYHYHFYDDEGINYRQRTSYICNKCWTSPCECSKLIVTKKYCIYCGAEKFGRYCAEYCELIESQCEFCEDITCSGIRPCNVCNSLFHNDCFVESFRLCKECLRFLYEINLDVLNLFERLRDQESRDDIKEAVYGVMKEDN